jgi:Na+/H+ antiporter NhaC
MEHRRLGLLAVSPLFVFLVTYLVTSILLNDFYKMPITVAFLISSIYAIATTWGIPVEERISHFSAGAGNSNIMLMIWIFILAGAFAKSAKAMGSVDATVNLTLQILPESMLLPGLFLAACFISISIGTSVGTIVALTPMAVGVATQTGSSVPLIVGCIVGGAFFGDNLSFISDTTIVATRTQGCRMKDKFLTNIRIVAPAAVLIFILYMILGTDIHTLQEQAPIDWIKVIPYVAVLVMATCGVNVMTVLIIGCMLTGILGMATDTYDLFGWAASLSEGILSMSELIIVTLLAGGMLELIKFNGGIDYLTEVLTRKIHGKRGAELSIATLVTLANACTANNTIAIITVGPIAHEISQHYGVDNRKSASILDTFSCFAQGIIPYGAQLLMASGLSSLAPNEILGYLYYPFALGLFALLSILFRYPKKYS